MSGPTSIRCTSSGVGAHRAKPVSDPGHVLEPIPAADLDHEPAPMRSVGGPRRASRGAVGPALGCRRGGSNGHGGRRRHRSSRPVRTRIAVTSAGSSSLFLAEKGSMDGGITHRRVLVDPGRCVRLAREDEGVGVLDVRPQECPAPRSVALVLLVAARRGSATPRCAPSARRPSTMPAVCGSCSSTMSLGRTTCRSCSDRLACSTSW